MLASSLQASSLDPAFATFGSHEPPRSNRLSWSLTSGNTSRDVRLDAFPVATNAVKTTYISHTPQAATQGESWSYGANRQASPYASRSPYLVIPASSEPGFTPFHTQQPSIFDMVEDIYPISPPSDEYSSRRTSSIDIRMKTEAQPGQPPSEIVYLQTFKRDRTPPRNSKDEIFCDHSECAGKRETFTRACEWNKHMDKHERPYKCLERGCERLLGFTYSGGLLRHNREVHKKNLSTRNPLYCPFHNCNRNSASGHGFTRLENLNEHKRRRHPGEEPPTTPRIDSSISPADSAYKRKRNVNSVHEEDSESDDGSDEETSLRNKRSRAMSDQRTQPLIDRLRSELRQRDEQISEQRDYIDSLRSTIRSLQQQNIAQRP